MYRFANSIGVTEREKPMRTLRAYDCLVTPQWIYQRSAGSVWRWSRTTFPQRCAANEPLTAPASSFSNPSEKILGWDGFVNPDQIQGWKLSGQDSIDRLTGYDVDDQGYLYIAVTVNGWAICEPQRMRALGQQLNAGEQPGKIIALRVGQKYYAIVSSGGRSALYDVTERAHPVKVSSNAPRVLAFAKNADHSRVAVIDFNTHLLSVYSAAGIVAGAPPLFIGAGYASVASDGTNFYALRQSAIDVIAPSGGEGYVLLKTFPIDPTLSPSPGVGLHYGEGYLVFSGGAGTLWAWRLYRASDGTAVPIDISATTSSQEINAWDGVVVDGQLLLCGKSVGDAYKLDAAPAPIPTPPTVPPTPKIIEAIVSQALYPNDQKAEAKAWYDYVKAKYNPTHIDMVPHPDGWLVYWF